MSSFLLQSNGPDKYTGLYRMMIIYLHTIPRNAEAQTVLQICISFFIKVKKRRPGYILKALKYFNTIRILEQTLSNLK